MLTLRTIYSLLIEVEGKLKRQCFKQGVDQRCNVAYKLSSKNVLFSNHESSKENAGDTEVMLSGEVVRQLHNDADDEDKEDNEFLEGHEGGQRHNSDTVG